MNARFTSYTRPLLQDGRSDCFIYCIETNTEGQVSEETGEHAADERTRKTLMKQISNLPDNVFKAVVIEMLTELGRRMDERRSSTKT